MPKMAQKLAASIGVGAVTVDRQYRLHLPDEVEARVYLQGVNEATHGIADSLISVLAIRSSEIAADLIAARRARDGAQPVPQAVPQPL
jgi:L-ornithine N5-oxygenase